MTDYVGILDGSGKAWGIRIPDLPGCYGAGASPDAALADVMGAAREWIAHHRAKGLSVLKPRNLAQVAKAGEIDAAQGEAAIIIPVVLDEGRTVKANLTMDAGLLEAIDAEAGRRGVSRSAFIASMARKVLARV